MDQRDNHIFKGLATLAAYGCTYKEAVAGWHMQPPAPPPLLLLLVLLRAVPSRACVADVNFKRHPSCCLGHTHILTMLGQHCCLLACLPAVGKDVMQRVGSKGPAADLVRALVARLTPSLLPPEVLHAAMEGAAHSQEGACRLAGSPGVQ